MVNRLLDLLERATVRVIGKSQGSGFFVARDIVLTCAHVVGETAASAPHDIQVIDRDGAVATRVISADLLPDPNEDLAILRVAPVDRPAVHLDLQANLHDPLVVVGFPDYGDGRGPRADEFVGRYEGRTQVGTNSALTFIKFSDARVIRGFSGGPLLNTRTRRVIGIVVETLDARFPVGGWAIPVEFVYRRFPPVASENLQFHASDDRWSRAGDDDADRRQAARRRITDEAGIPYSEASFIERIEKGEDDLVRLFIDAGIRVNAMDKDDDTALFVAMKHGRSEMAHMLVLAGADPNARTHGRAGVLQGASALAMAVCDDQRELVRAMIAAGADVNAKAWDRSTPIYWAAGFGNVALTTLLLNAGASATTVRDDGMTALMLAARGSEWSAPGDCDHAAVIRLLVAAGADLEARHGKHRFGSTALMYAAECGRPRLVRELLRQGADPNTKTTGGETALLAAVDPAESPRLGERYVPVIALLLEAGADTTVRRWNKTPLEIAEKGLREGRVDPEIVRLLAARTAKS